MEPACHRSLYGYQLRAALALAIENPHVAVTFLPLGCTGATIRDGLFNGQPARELNCGGAELKPCPRLVPGQLSQLRDILSRAQRGKGRKLDLVFLTVGANDIGFSGLVADILVEGSNERALFSRFGIISSIEAAQAKLDTQLAADFRALRAALKPLIEDALERVVFTAYANPALAGAGQPCPGGRGGLMSTPPSPPLASACAAPPNSWRTDFSPRSRGSSPAAVAAPVPMQPMP